MTQPHDEPERFTPVPDPRPYEKPCPETGWPEMSWPVSARTRLAGRALLVTPLDLETDAEPLFWALDYDAVWAKLDGRPDSPSGMSDHLRELAARADCQVWTVRLAGLVGQGLSRHMPGGHMLGRHTLGSHGVVDQVVGMSCFLDAAARDARLEIGHTLYAPQVWGGVVNPETKLLLLGHAFDTLGAGRVQLKTDVRNTRAQQAIAQLGARYEGTLRRHSRRADGTMRDIVLFSIITEDWPDIRRGLMQRLGRLR